MEIWGNHGATFRHCAVFPLKECYIKKKLGLWRAQKCNPLVGAKCVLTCVRPQTTLSNVRQYRAENGNLGKSGPNFRLGAVFAPWRNVGPNFPQYLLSSLYCLSLDDVVYAPAQVSALFAPTRGIHFWTLHTPSFLWI